MMVLKILLFTLFISVSKCRTPDKVFCVSEQCDGPISKAKTLLTYTSADPDLLSFPINREATIYMKSAGTNPDLWFVDINGKTGFVNYKFLKEYKIIKKSPYVTVPYEPKKLEDVVQPDKVLQAHEVIEGTTIYTTEAAVKDEEHDSATDSPINPSNEEVTPNLIPETPLVIDNKPSLINEIDTESQSEDNSELKDNKQTSAPSETKIQADVNLVNVVDSQEPTVETEPDLSHETGEVNAEQNQHVEPQILQETSKENTPGAIPPQQILTTGSGTFSSDSIIEREKKDYLPSAFAEAAVAEQTENKELNDSALNHNIDNTDTPQEFAEEAAPNGNSLTEIAEDLDKSTENSVNEPIIKTLESQEKPPIKAVVDQVNEPVGPVQQTILEQAINAIVPPIETNTAAETGNINIVNENSQEKPGILLEPFVETSQTKDAQPPQSPDPLPFIPTETLPTTTETIPAIYPPAATQMNPNPETIPPIVNIEVPPTTETPLQEIPPMYPYTTSSSLQSEESNNYYITTESPGTEQSSTEQSSTEDIKEIIDALPDASTDSDSSDDIYATTTVAPAEENTKGFFSNMYSTVADIWPSTTPAPENVYNPDYPTYESEKTESDEGFSFMKYLKNTYYTVMGISEESKALFPSVGETCFSDEYCDGTSNNGTNRLLTFLLTTASSVLLFTLGYYYIDNRRQDGRLIGTINSLQRDLLFTTKECEILKEELSTTKNKLAGIEDSSFGMDDMVQSLKEEINELKATNERLRNSLDDNEKLLRVSENTAGELQNTLSEVENTLSELLAERANSEEQILELNGKIQAFEEELISVSRERDNFQLKYVSAETALEEFKKQKKQFEEINQQLVEAKNTIELQRHEIEALKEAIKELKSGMSSDVDVTSLIDHTEIKAKLSKALQEKTTFETKYEAEHKERARLAEELKVTQESLTTSNQSATEAMTRLEVLGKYFQERESELLKELSAKESLWLSKQGESASTVEKIEILQQEVQRYKEKCDALTLELAEQESARRSAVSDVESRAHAAWLEARAARRDADAARDEAAALRRKLAAISVADGAVSPHHKVSSPLDAVENPVIPPPLPPMFLPPPLLPPLPRPPPLGRLPSPHPPRYGDRRYSPDSRYSPESRYSPDSRYSPEPVRYSPDSRYSPRSRRSPYSPRSRRRSRSRERYEENRVSRSRNGPAPPDTETEYNSDSPSRQPRRRGRYSRHSGPSSGSGCSSESDK